MTHTSASALVNCAAPGCTRHIDDRTGKATKIEHVAPHPRAGRIVHINPLDGKPNRLEFVAPHKRAGLVLQRRKGEPLRVEQWHPQASGTRRPLLRRD